VKDALIVTMLSLVPRRAGARGMGLFARTGLSRLLARWFVRAYQVDLVEAEGAFDDYPTLEALFTRKLRPGVRPVDDRPGMMVSPVDGRVAAVGTTSFGHLDVVPGKAVDVRALTGEDYPTERDVAVLYLSPKDYHRVHVPREGEATAWRYVPGTLWPVFPAAVRRVEGLFQRNERAIVRFDTDHGPLDVVLVGAFGVGRITLAVSDLVTNLDSRPVERVEVIEPPTPMARADELGVFHLGSTVILVAPLGRWRWTVAPGDVVKVGRPIAHAVGALSDHSASDASSP